MYEILTQLLSIHNYKVIGVEMADDTITLDIESTLDGAKCPRCGTYCTDMHENHPRTVRDLPISGKACYLRFVRRRFFCSHCNKSFSESLSFVQERRDYTNRYQERIFHQVKENNITAVQRSEGLTYDQIESIFLTEAKARIPANPFANLKRLGIDEVWGQKRNRGGLAKTFFEIVYEEFDRHGGVLFGTTKQAGDQYNFPLRKVEK